MLRSWESLTPQPPAGTGCSLPTEASSPLGTLLFGAPMHPSWRNTRGTPAESWGASLWARAPLPRRGATNSSYTAYRSSAISLSHELRPVASSRSRSIQRRAVDQERDVDVAPGGV